MDKTDIAYTWQGFIAYAESFGQAANHVAHGIDMLHAAPIGALACHCMELSLKAVVIARGASPEAVKALGHNLKKLFRESHLDWSDIDTDAVDFYHGAIMEHAFRYRNSNRPYAMDTDHLLLIMTVVFERCLDAVAPDANRSLNPRYRSG